MRLALFQKPINLVEAFATTDQRQQARQSAAVLAGIVVMRAAYEPRIAGDAIGTTPIFNWLLWGYGIPAASFWLGSMLLRRRGDDAPLRTVEAAAILFTVLLVFLEIRHAIYGGDIYHVTPTLAEFARWTRVLGTYKGADRRVDPKA